MMLRDLNILIDSEIGATRPKLVLVDRENGKARQLTLRVNLICEVKKNRKVPGDRYRNTKTMESADKIHPCNYWYIGNYSQISEKVDRGNRQQPSLVLAPENSVISNN